MRGFRSLSTAFALALSVSGAPVADAQDSAAAQATPLLSELRPTYVSLTDPGTHVAELYGLLEDHLERMDQDALVRAAESGDADAQLAWAAGLIYGFGLVKPNTEYGAHWASQSCESGNLLACVSLAQLQISMSHIFPEGYAADAAVRLEDYCDDDAYTACFLRARLLHRGRYVEVDRRRALRLFRDACENGVTRSCTWAGSYYYSGETGSPNLHRAIRYFAMGCELGDDRACLDATIAAVDEYSEGYEAYGVMHTQDEFRRRVARRNYAPRFVENLMTPWVYWPGADISGTGLTPVRTATVKLYGQEGLWSPQGTGQRPWRALLFTTGNTRVADRAYWPTQRERAANVHCASLDIAACFGEVMTLLAGSEDARSAEPDWALMSAYCDQDVLIACRLGEWSEDWAFLVDASDEAKVALLSPYCLRDENPHVQACRYAGDAALRLAQNDPFYFPQALQMHKQGCDATRLESFCNAADENPVSGLSLMDAYRRNDLDHIRMVLEVGGAIQGERPTARNHVDVGQYDLAAQAVVDGRFDVLDLINQYVDLAEYEMVNGELLIAASAPNSFRYDRGAVTERLRRSFDGTGSTYVLSWEQGESRRERLLDMGLSPQVRAARSRTIYDVFESAIRSRQRAEELVADNDRRLARHAESARRLREQEARRREEVRTAILGGVTQALTDANARIAADNRARDAAERRRMREINDRAQNTANYHQRRTEAARESRDNAASQVTDARMAELTRERQRIAEAAEERRRNEEARAEREQRQQERNEAIRREREARLVESYRSGQRAEEARISLADRVERQVREQWQTDRASSPAVDGADWQRNALRACRLLAENISLQNSNHDFAAAESAFQHGCDVAHLLKYSTAGGNVLHCHKRGEFQDDLYDRLSERGLTAYSNYGDQAWLAWEQNMGCTDAD